MTPAFARARPGRTTIAAACAASLLVLCACEEENQGPGGPGGEDGELVLTMSEFVPTVALASWDLDLEAIDDAYVEFGPTCGAGARAPLHLEDGVLSGHVLGMKPATEYCLRGVAEVDSETFASAEILLTTGYTHTGMADLSLEVTDADLVTPGFLSTSTIAPVPTVAILDRDGDYVWWHHPEDEGYMILRSRLSREGESVLYLGTYSDEGDAELERFLVQVSIDGSEVDVHRIPGAHHDFVELPGGKIAILISDPREHPDFDEPVAGDVIIEYSLEDGSSEVVWSAWDTLHFSGHVMNDEAGGLDWTHANALDYDVEDDTYSVSLLAPGAIVTVDRATGEVLEQVGGIDSDYEFAGGGIPAFTVQHQFQFLGDSLLLFDNGTPTTQESRALELALDRDAGVVTKTWSYVTDPSLYCPAMGDVSRLPNGNTLVTWGSAGQMEEVTGAGERVWQLNTAIAAGFGYTTLHESLYP